ncbi:MAG: hypothetical protein K8R86_08405 [Bacteroidales bacterium]|nr:hypothetical protein [Bacteroidales bacterium]
MKNLFIILWILCPIIAVSQSNVIAHRGASSIAPENTLAAFNKAIEAGCDYIEMDIRMSKDDSVMVIHDETLDRTTDGAGQVNQFSYNQLKKLSAGYAEKFDSDYTDEQIPSLFDVLLLAKGKVNVCIDQKNSPEMPVIDLVLKMNMKKQVYLMSYNVEKLIRIKTINPQIQTILLKNTLTNVDLDIARDIGVSGVSTSYISSGFLVNKAHEVDLKYWAGIVNDPAKAESLFKNNVDAIITDYPQLMTMNIENQINISPNPFRESVKIQLKNSNNIQRVWIINAKGLIIHEFSIPYPNPLIWQPDKNLSRGLYLVYMIKNETIIFEKILFID